MPSSGPNSPGTTSNDTSIGTIAWSNTDNAKVSDNVYATAIVAINQITNYLVATNFGFAIPTNSVIDGIVMEAEVSVANKGIPGDNAARIVKGGVIGTTDKSSATGWVTTDTYLSHGGTTDLWGLTWISSDINATNFGFALSAKRGAAKGNRTARIDHIRCTVYYTSLFPKLKGTSSIQNLGSLKF